VAQKKVTAAGLDVSMKRSMIDSSTSVVSVRRQCQLIGLHRSTLSLCPPSATESPESLKVMEAIDEIYTACPFYGSRKIVFILNEKRIQVNRKRVQRLMRVMGIQSIAPKPNTSRRNKQHKVYPYLLRNVPINRVNQVWSTDITYIRMGRGFCYLVAIIDWHSRAVLSWRLSNTMDTGFCLEALKGALAKFGRPEIFNTDQGSQFTSDLFTEELLSNGVKISMDGKGRYLDNILVERLWRSVKYEEIYPKQHETIGDVRKGLEGYFEFYNRERPHQSLDNRRPMEVYEEEVLLKAA
jgi:putative transposase